MSSVTAVPLRPIEKGSLVWLWLGVAVVLVAAMALAWSGTHRLEAITLKVISEGKGASPTKEDVALIGYVGKLDNGTVFDQQAQAPLPVGDVVKGFSQGLQRMKRGGHYELIIPPGLGYGSKVAGPIPANSTLHFDVKLLDFMPRAEFVQRMQEMQRMQQQQGGAPGAVPGGEPAAPSPAPGQ